MARCQQEEALSLSLSWRRGAGKVVGAGEMTAQGPRLAAVLRPSSGAHRCNCQSHGRLGCAAHVPTRREACLPARSLSLSPSLPRSLALLSYPMAARPARSNGLSAEPNRTEPS